MMKFDPYSGDYGPNFFGHAWSTATYLAKDPEFGWLAFGGNVEVSDRSVTVEPRDSQRQRVYLAPLGLWLTLDSGQFQRVTLNETTNEVKITLAPGDAYTSTALLRVEQPARIAGIGTIAPQDKYEQVRGAYAVPLGNKPVVVGLRSQEI
jgi:hypothetical protein